jgi:hypothetical protein
MSLENEPAEEPLLAFQAHAMHFELRPPCEPIFYEKKIKLKPLWQINLLHIMFFTVNIE